MSDEMNRRLAEAKERIYRLHKAERRKVELDKRLNEQERLIMKLEMQLESEQADVDRLSRLTLTNLFHTILRSKEEQLELERQQALQAALKLEEAKQQLLNTQADLMAVGDNLSNFRNAEHEYSSLLASKEASLRHAPSSSKELDLMEDQIAEQIIHVKEISEALSAGSRVLSSLNDASNSLEKAENWGKWDLWANGGMISTMNKHNHIDDAKQFIRNANHQMLNFRDELQDLNRTIQIHIDISDSLRLADYWFDGLITDWIVQGRIENSQQQTLKAIHKIRDVVHKLREEHTTAQAKLTMMISRRISWIENTKLDA